MRKNLYEIKRKIIVGLIEKMKMNIIINESQYEKIMFRSYQNKLSYEDYMLRSRISVFRYRNRL